MQRDDVEGPPPSSPTSLLHVCRGWHDGTTWALGSGSLVPAPSSSMGHLNPEASLAPRKELAAGSAVPAAQVALCLLLRRPKPPLVQVGRATKGGMSVAAGLSLSLDERERQLSPADF